MSRPFSLGVNFMKKFLLEYVKSSKCFLIFAQQNLKQI